MDVNKRENIVKYLWLNYRSYLKFINVNKYSDSGNYISKANRYVIEYLIKISQEVMVNNYLKLIWDIDKNNKIQKGIYVSMLLERYIK